MISGFVRVPIYSPSVAVRSVLGYNHTESLNVSYRKFHKCIPCNARKPFWLPIAKSKMFIVPQPPILPKEEFEEIEYHKKNYKTLMDSLMELQREMDRIAQAKYSIQMKSTDEEILEMFTKNDALNKVVAQNREKALKEEWSKAEENILFHKERRENLKMVKQKEQEEFIKSELVRLESAIKIEDLDEVIEKAMSTVTDYNFAIDLKGNYYKGRNTTTMSVEK